MLSSWFSNIRNTRFDQSSPVKPISESRGGSLSVTDGGRTNRNPCVQYWITKCRLINPHRISPLLIAFSGVKDPSCHFSNIQENI